MEDIGKFNYVANITTDLYVDIIVEIDRKAVSGLNVWKFLQTTMLSAYR